MIRLPYSAGPVLVVAIRTFNQSFIYTMAKRHFELRFLLQVTGVAKVRLRLAQQKFLRLREVWRVAGDAAYVVLAME